MPQVPLTVQPHEVAPAGIGGEAELKEVWLTIRYRKAFELTVTPVVNGERITAEAVTLNRPAPAVGERVHRFNLPFYRDVDHTGTTESRRGLRGTWFTVLIEGSRKKLGGRLSIDGVDLIYDVVREHQPDVSWQALPWAETALPDPVEVFLGASGGNAVYRLLDGRDDAGAGIELRARTVHAAPAGTSGECIFRNVYIGTTRNNPNDYDLELTVFVDEHPHETITVTLPATASPTQDVQEVSLYRHWPESGTPQMTHHLRGGLISVEIHADSLPAGDMVLDGIAVEFEVVRESQEAA